jgi:uncharacterized Ntn-hydrolase superfamily protein
MKSLFFKIYTLILIVFLILIIPCVLLADDTDNGTFSIVAYDPETGEWGIAVASKVLAVGYIVPWAKANVGAIATQALSNVSYGVEGLELLGEGLTAEEVLQKLIESDPDSENRQIGIVDGEGNTTAFTGENTLEWSGHIIGENYAIQGNILTGENVLAGMERVYLETGGPLARRLIEALKAGEMAGGDSRGKQSSAILVVKEGGGYQGAFDRLVDIRVDDDEDPITELERIYELWEYRFVLERYLDSEWEADKEYALSIIERVLEGKVEDADTHNNIAWALATRKLYPEKAIEIALKAHQLSPDDPNIMDTVAESYYAYEDYEKAIEWEKRALELDPENAFFKEQLDKFEGKK